MEKDDEYKQNLKQYEIFKLDDLSTSLFGLQMTEFGVDMD